MKKDHACLLISLAVAAVLAIFALTPLYQILELKSYDLRMNLRVPPPQDKRILYVEMDEAAVQDIGRWPWPRETHAHLIETLKTLGARQVLFDVTFQEPSPVAVDKNRIEAALKNTAGNIDIAGLKQDIHASLKDNDEILAQALKESSVFIGCKFNVVHLEREIRRDREYPRLRGEILAWQKQNPSGDFRGLPARLAHNRYFSRKETEDIFQSLKIFNILENNIPMDIEEVSARLNLPPEKIRLFFNKARGEAVEEITINFLDKNPGAEFKEIIWEYEIANIDLQETFRKAWDKTVKEKEFANKFALKINNPAGVLPANEISTPILPFIRAAKGVGFLNGIPDGDGSLRSVPLFVKHKEKIYPHIAVAAFIDLTRPGEIILNPGRTVIFKNAAINGRKKNVIVPVNEECETLINWAGKWEDTFRRISCADIYRLYSLRKNLADNAMIARDNDDPQVKKMFADDQRRLEENEKKLKKQVEGNICIIGLTAPGTHDYNPIPYEEAYPMVGTHGNVINSLLNEKFLRRLPWWANTLFLVLLALLIGRLVAKFNAAKGLASAVGILLASCIAAQILFHYGIWLDLTSPVLLSFLSYIGITSFKFAAEEREKRWIKQAFSKYVSRDVMEEILKNPGRLKLGGERRTISVLFSDIRGFTTYSEKRKPEEVVTILNEYLDEMTKIIFQNQGTLDKYVGDEIMAIFGAPKLEGPVVSSRRAVITAWQMMNRLMELRDKWLAEGLEPLDIGIGINTGEMVVGNMGSTLVMSYTVIGDAVNLGARIEALTRKYNNHIMISEFTYEYVKDIVEANPLEAVKVKGKEKPVMMYEVIRVKETDI